MEKYKKTCVFINENNTSFHVACMSNYMDLSAVFARASLPIANAIISKWHDNPCDLLITYHYSSYSCSHCRAKKVCDYGNNRTLI